MQKKYPLVSIYDAHPEREVFGNPDVVSRAHSLAHALAHSKLGAVGSVGSSIVSTVLTTLSENGVHVIGLSPASTHIEHQKAYRLPPVSFPLLFTGRGAFGSDITAMASSHGLIISGSGEEALLGILSFLGDRGIPVGIFTEEGESDVRARIHNKYPNRMMHIHVSKDPNQLVQEIASEIRRQHLSEK